MFITPSRFTSQCVRQQQWRGRGNDVGLLIANRGQWASPEEFSITIGRHYVRVKNWEVSLPNRTIVIWDSKSGGFHENQEGWQP